MHCARGAHVAKQWNPGAYGAWKLGTNVARRCVVGRAWLVLPIPAGMDSLHSGAPLAAASGTSLTPGCHSPAKEA